MKPISYHSYILKATQKLLRAKTKNGSLFQSPATKLHGDIFQKQAQVGELMKFHLKKELLDERTIKLKSKESVLLFFAKHIPFFWQFWTKSKPLLKLWT